MKNRQEADCKNRPAELIDRAVISVSCRKIPAVPSAEQPEMRFFRCYFTSLLLNIVTVIGRKTAIITSDTPIALANIKPVPP